LAPSGEVHATARTRENFQRMRPLLEKQLEGCARPDLALREFANFTQGYGARSLLYESLCVSPQALELSNFEQADYHQHKVFLANSL
jgi:glutamine synthetase adenylyltransferase